MTSTDEDSGKNQFSTPKAQQLSTNGSFPLIDQKTKPQLDMEKMRDILVEETCLYTKGVQDTDVDWFITDSSIDPNADVQPLVNSPRETNLNSQATIPTSHLTSAISNSNENYTNKTKPSIAPIQEENIASDTSPRHHRHEIEQQQPRRRSSVSVSPSGGFLSKLKSKFHKESPTPPGNHQDGLFKSGYSVNPDKKSNDSSNSSIASLSSSPKLVSGSNLQRTMSTPAYTHDTCDPRLEEYIKFYRKSDRRASVASSSHSAKDECLPSVLVNASEPTNYNKTKDEVNASRVSGFFKRKNSVAMKNGETSLPRSLVSVSVTPQSQVKNGLENNPSFQGLKPLKRVAFHSSTFLIDPPQQIPSRTPRKGNVEVLPNGTVNIRPLTDEERLEIEKSQKGLGGGIVVGGTGALGYIKKDSDPPKPGENNLNAQDDDNNDDGSNQSSESLQLESEPSVDKHAKSFTIDTPMARHQAVNYSVPIKKMALDTMYARCCHLREILPIPAILKQIPKGSMAPIPVLQLRNPTPTMIEIQSFADFLRIAPVICVSLDGVNFSVEQFKILLSAMSAKKQLEKLSLRNTPIDQKGWSLLCWFLSRNTVLNRLDITQCPSLSVNTLKKKKKKTDSKFDETLVRMVSNKDNRSDVDWELFVATLVARGGIEELILTGCCITDIEIFEKLISLAVLKKTSRLGLAFNQLTSRHMKIIVDEWLFKDFARGIDFGYNDFLSVHMLKILVDYSKRPDFDQILLKSTLSFVSLNSTNVSLGDIFKESFERVLMKLPNLKYVDFSNNQRLFGTFGKSDNEEADANEVASVNYFISKLPLFPKLVRLHLENENFSKSSVLQIAEILPFCKSLGYFSILGSKLDFTCGSALVNAVKNSQSLINVDADSDNFPDIFKERMGLYTMRNMERLLYSAKKADVKTPLLSEDSAGNVSMTEQLHEILRLKSQQKLDLQLPEITKFIERAKSISHGLRQTINELLRMQLKNRLDLDGKETLIRLIFIDSSIEKGLMLIDPSLVDDNNKNAGYLTSMIGTREGNEETQQFEQSDHLDPQPAASVLANKSPSVMSRSDSRTSLNNLNKEEGSVLKLAKLRDFHSPNSPYPESTGEELRNKLMSVELADLDKVIDFLSDLKKKGVSLEKVFQCHENQGANDHEEGLLDIEHIKSRLQKLSVEQMDGVSKDVDTDADEINTGTDKTHTLNNTYDEVLKNLFK